MARKKPAAPATSFESSFAAQEGDDVELEALPAPRRYARALDERMITTIQRALRQGLPLPLVAGLVGISKSSLLDWVQRGMDENCTDPLLQRLAVTVDFERSQQAVKGIHLLGIHALSDHKAAIALLKAQDPHTWMERSASKVDVEVTSKPKVEDLSMLTDEELALRAQIEEKIEAARLRLGRGE